MSKKKHKTKRSINKGPKMKKIGHCDYCYSHEGDHRKKEVFLCGYCKKYFCEKHLKPKPSTLPKFRDTDPKSRLLMEEYHKEGGHPCFPYFDEWEKEKKREGDEWGKTLDILTGRSERLQSIIN